METYFSITINGTHLEFISMNVSAPKLFQVFASVDGKRERFHMQGNGTDTLVFTLPENCPSFLLEIEDAIREKIFAMAMDRKK